jgi:EAL domain-containing protein (putative c-di-GMP-specific phosphodiesterase class I)
MSLAHVAPAPVDGALRAARTSLWMAYQPIVDCQGGRCHGYEALVRNGEPTLLAPDHLFLAAERQGQLFHLGRQIRAEVAADLVRLPMAEPSYLFVNLHARDLLDDELYDARAPLSQHAHRIVYEITEREALDGVDDAEARVARLRALGFRVAIDDLGAGFAGLSTLALLAPEVVKLDMSLVRDLHANPRKRTIVECLVDLCRRLDVQLVAEGVESLAERDLLVKLGCTLLQGYFFGRPGRGFVPPASL